MDVTVVLSALAFCGATVLREGVVGDEQFVRLAGNKYATTWVLVRDLPVIDAECRKYGKPGLYVENIGEPKTREPWRPE